MNPTNSPTPSAPADETGTGGGAATSGALADTKNKIVKTARDTAAKVKETAATTASRAREEAERFATERKETTANRIGDYSSAIHDSARALEEKDPNIAWFSHRAADKLQSVADYVRTSDFASLRRDAEDVARRHPAVFFGGMFLAGLILGNVMKASRRKADDTVGFDDDTTDWSDAPTESMTQSDLTAAERAAAGI